MGSFTSRPSILAAYCVVPTGHFVWYIARFALACCSTSAKPRVGCLGPTLEISQSRRRLRSPMDTQILSPMERRLCPRTSLESSATRNDEEARCGPRNSLAWFGSNSVLDEGSRRCLPAHCNDSEVRRANEMYDSQSTMVGPGAFIKPRMLRCA